MQYPERSAAAKVWAEADRKVRLRRDGGRDVSNAGRDEPLVTAQ